VAAGRPGRCRKIVSRWDHARDIERFGRYCAPRPTEQPPERAISPTLRFTSDIPTASRRCDRALQRRARRKAIVETATAGLSRLGDLVSLARRSMIVPFMWRVPDAAFA
jgi:hypothetical protein